MIPPDDNLAAPDPPGDSYVTLAGLGQAEIKIQRSRFLAEAAPVSDLVAAKRIVARATKQHRACRHVCYAWRGGHGKATQEVRHDAGEPAGTAGEPILAALRRAAVTDCVIVVARYFGGVKLGTGGLARAYGAAAAAALAAAPRRTVRLGQEFCLLFPYARQKAVSHLLAQHGGHTVAEDYAEAITWRVWLPAAASGAFAEAIREATAGEVKIKAPA